MSQYPKVTITREFMRGAVDRLREFLAPRGHDLMQQISYEALSRALFNRGWGTVKSVIESAERPTPGQPAPVEPEPIPIANAVDHEDDHDPNEAKWLLMGYAGSSIIVIPRAEDHADALTDLRNLWKTSDEPNRDRLAWISEEGQWPRTDNVMAKRLPDNWRTDERLNERIFEQCIHFNFHQVILVPLLEPKLGSLFFSMSGGTIRCVAFMVADSLTEARAILQGQFGRSFRSDKTNLVWWPFGTMSPAGGVGIGGSVRKHWPIKMPVAKWPLLNVTKEQFEILLEFQRIHEQTMDAWHDSQEGPISSDELKKAVSIPEVEGKYAYLKQLGIPALIELRALIILGLEWNDQPSWTHTLGQAHRDLFPERRERGIKSDPEEFVGASDLAELLPKGLAILLGFKDRPE